MYNPFSVKAFGKALVFANFVVENFDRKSTNASWGRPLLYWFILFGPSREIGGQALQRDRRASRTRLRFKLRPCKFYGIFYFFVFEISGRNPK
jgi:hypothetical protein